MIAADTSSLISLASIDLLDTVLTEFNIHTTEIVVAELGDTAEYDDSHGNAAEVVLDRLTEIDTHQVRGEFTSSRIDEGEGSCVRLANELDADFLITDDLRALPEVQTLTDPKVALSPIVLKALVEKDVLGGDQARNKLDELAYQRDWLGAPIYRRAKNLFE